VASAFLDERASLIPDRPRQLEVLQRVIRFFCPEPRLILDLGTGDAILMATLLESFRNAHGVAIDFSPLMLEQAEHRLERFGERAAIREADLRNPSWRESLSTPFDVVVSGFAIHHLPDERKRALYRKIHQSLNETGARA